MFLQIEVTCILSVNFLNTKDFRKERKKINVHISDGQIPEINKQIHLDFFSVRKSVSHSISQSFREESVTVSQSVSKSTSHLLSHSLS